MPTLRTRLAATLFGASLALPGSAQGTTSYLNFDSPAHKPIACTTVGARTYLLVCNAPDNALEVYVAGNPNAPVFVVRVPVGLEPVTVVAKPTLLAGNVRRCYVANWLGDSITAIDLAPTGAIQVVRTERVGDEPVGIAFHPADESLVVTFAAQASWGWFDGNTLQPVQAGSQFLELLDATQTHSVKEPRAIAFSPATAGAPNVPGQLCILNLRGGSDATQFDYDLWSTSSVAASAVTQQATLPDVAGLGSTNFNMAFAPNGDLYVVGQQARNKALANFVEDLGEPVMRGLVTASTGFVTSQLVRVRGIGSLTPVVDPPLDLNSATVYQGAQAGLAITQPTDVVVKGSGAAGTRIFVTGFNSDSLGVVQLTAGGFTLSRIDAGHANKFTGSNLAGVMRGPRGLALNPAQDRVYVYNRIEHSVTVVDANFVNPAAALIATFALQRDPTPAYIKDGRKFLYSSQLSGGNNVSCASCHIDANSDYLAWNLSDGVHVGPSPNPLFSGDPLGTLGPNTIGDPASPIPDRKGPMQTQSLRGLVNFEVAGDQVQDAFYSNKPYHWRGDRATFQAFNGAFVNLMAIAAPFSPSQGIPPAAMDAYRDFINSVHYPPNPEQPIQRAYSGSMTTPNPSGASNPLDDVDAGSGAQWGLKNFHIQNSDGATCVACHSLPVGSNYRTTETLGHVNSVLDLSGLETTALRGLVAKEAQLWRPDPSTGFQQVHLSPGGQPVATGEFGLVHTGKSTLTFAVGATMVINQGSRSIFDFVDGFAIPLSHQQAISRYMREFDTGIAPIVGRVLTVTSTSNPSAVTAAMNDFETQAVRANAGLAVHARIGTVQRGFWFDVTQHATTLYVEEPHAGVTPLAPISRATLLGFAATAGNLVVVQSVPLGSARRVAFLDGGTPPSLAGGAPTGIALAGCRPNTANAMVPSLTVNWFDLFKPGSGGSSQFVNLGNNKATLYYQASLIFHTPGASPAGFGMAAFRHEPPRRFVVTGNGIREGSMLRVFSPISADWATASPTTPPTTAPTTATNPDPLELPLHPAIDRVTGNLEWQTAVEMEAFHLLALMNGGRNNPAVMTLAPPPVSAVIVPDLLDSLNPPVIPPAGGGPTQDFFQPLLHNWFFVQVVNDPGNPATTTSAGSWQRITLQ